MIVPVHIRYTAAQQKIITYTFTDTDTYTSFNYIEYKHKQIQYTSDTILRVGVGRVMFMLLEGSLAFQQNVEGISKFTRKSES
jgi:hypothetical protein